MAKPGRKPVAYSRSPLEEQMDRALEIARELEVDTLDEKAVENPLDEVFKNRGLPKGYTLPNRVMLTVTVLPSTVEVMNKIKLRTGLSRGRLLDWMAEAVWKNLQEKKQAREDADLAVRRQSRSFQRRRDEERAVRKAARDRVGEEE